MDCAKWRVWDPHADGKLYPFNDWHAAMVYLGADRHGDVERPVNTYRREPPAANETARWARQTGLPLIEGFSPFWRGDYSTVERHQLADTIQGRFSRVFRLYLKSLGEGKSPSAPLAQS